MPRVSVGSRSRGVTTLEYIVLAAVLVLGAVAAFVLFRDKTSASVEAVGAGIGQIGAGEAAVVGERYADPSALQPSGAEPENTVAAAPPPVDSNAAGLEEGPPADEGGGFWSGALDWTQTGLDVLGLVPGLGEIADGANAAIYTARGDYVNAGLSAAAMIPFAGWAATGGKIVNKGSKAIDKANDARKIAAATSKAKRGQTVLGHYKDGYLQLADEIGGRKFEIPKSVWDKMSDAERWAANQKFLDRMVARGDEVVLATPLDKVTPGSYFERELQYLRDKGYRPSKDGKKLLPPPPKPGK